MNPIQGVLALSADLMASTLGLVGRELQRVQKHAEWLDDILFEDEDFFELDDLDELDDEF